MIHGPRGSCNMSSPCMIDGKCSRYFPKQFQQTTIVDQDDHPVYKRRDHGNIVEKNEEQSKIFRNIIQAVNHQQGRISLAYIMGTTSKDSILFGGKVVVFGGDFRQILSDDSKRASFRYCTCDNQLILSLASM
ncbi:hypothetical protein Lal_00018504 [Lupinus albus]|nr:hypothetical protein Lal_00018504 [Lupinus albus]